MKKITLSMLTALAMSSVAFAGGDITPVEPEVNIPEVASMPGSFYVGAGYSRIGANIDEAFVGDTNTKIRANGAMFNAGYNYNEYFGIEGRYTMSVGDITVRENSVDTDFEGDISNMAIYLKGMYPVADAFSLYALVGYGKTTLDDKDTDESSESGFQWGIGANYAVTENIGLFADLTSWYSGEGFDDAITPDTAIASINVGVTYNF